MRNVAVISWSQTPYKRHETERSEVQMVMDVTRDAIARSGIPKKDIAELWNWLHSIHDSATK